MHRLPATSFTAVAANLQGYPGRTVEKADLCRTSFLFPGKSDFWAQRQTGQMGSKLKSAQGPPGPTMKSLDPIRKLLESNELDVIPSIDDQQPDQPKDKNCGADCHTG
jgi:hypothetical protein